MSAGENTRIMRMFDLNKLRVYNLLVGIISHAKPATRRLPIVQKAAMKLNMEPRFALGWNSAK